MPATDIALDVAEANHTCRQPTRQWHRIHTNDVVRLLEAGRDSGHGVVARQARAGDVWSRRKRDRGGDGWCRCTRVEARASKSVDRSVYVIHRVQLGGRRNHGAGEEGRECSKTMQTDTTRQGPHRSGTPSYSIPFAALLRYKMYHVAWLSPLMGIDAKVSFLRH